MSAEIYAQLAALAAEEHALVMDGRYDDLADLAARREPLLAQLPPAAPPDALGHLQEALRFQELVTVALIAARERTNHELAQSAVRRRGARGYAQTAIAGPPPPAQVDARF